MPFDDRTFKSFYLANFNAVVGLCSSYVRDDHTAMDITQEAFFKLYRQWDQVRFTAGNAKAFVYVAAKNLCFDYLRRKKFQGGLPEGLDERMGSDYFFFEEIIRQETIDAVRRAIGMLSGRNREVIEFTLRGKSNLEIAELLGLSINTVKWIKKAAYARMRAEIGDLILVLLLAQARGVFSEIA